MPHHTPQAGNPLSLQLVPLPHVLHSKTVSDPHSARSSEKEDKRSFLQKVAEFIHPAPESADELIETLAEAEDNQVIGADARVMLERVIRMADMTAGDVMVASTRMDLINIDDAFDVILHQVISTAHSRFPVYQGERENIIGILLAKDLVKLQRAPELNLRALLRPAVFVPETKGLHDLLRDFRSNRNHLAIVIDEFGRVAGLVTIEDVLEEIVGEIEDEHDEAPEVLLVPLDGGAWDVDARLELDDVGRTVDARLAEAESDVDTIGGLTAVLAGRVPEPGECFDHPSGWRIEVTDADERRINRLRLHPPVPVPEGAEE